eukprot:GSMAST32.ASY1.ANO1.272.1 assembled CDS
MGDSKLKFSRIGKSLRKIVGRKLSFSCTIDGRQFSGLSKVAEGGFSEVFRVKETTKGSKTKGFHFAVKKMCVTVDTEKDVHREISVHKVIDHPNLMPLLGFEMRESKDKHQEALLLFPLYTAGSLYDSIRNRNTFLSELEILRVCRGSLRGLASLHENNLCHLDVKPSNILLRNDKKSSIENADLAVLMDFGSAAPRWVSIKTANQARLIEERCAEKCTLPFRSPELYTSEGGVFDYAPCDIWSFGCTLFNAAFGYSPFESSKEGVKKLAICLFSSFIFYFFNFFNFFNLFYFCFMVFKVPNFVPNKF